MKRADDNALGVAAKRSSMTFFSDSASQYSHRVRIVLAEKGVTVDMIESDSAHPPAELADLNPYNSLPTLVDRDLVLYESKVMMEYLDERFPHPPLLPVYPVARAESRLYIHRIEKDWCSLVDSIQHSRSDNVVSKATKELRDGLVGIAPIFAEKPFFMSEEFTLVDCCLAPILWRLPSLGIEVRPGKQTKPLLAYMDALFGRESFQESLSEQEREMRP
ncbi:MAG: glutathione S-transferase N-terminal domain-containing protein [Halieaceae bacterium]|jgi:RNA polymerase-associated protein|uniref:glutathione S-transferase N-terminal domain-containing protein n=1 Tax=Haliea alexandrii TaxID=2448162 RepID=UPI001E2D5500|nr:glutathione S-transferase N-terminal domain-containing protein [Haliea alexandrii]MCR9186375.1 glutathione S-transferase N-terminal domain-containing protein [Halieaceae bacterium]